MLTLRPLELALEEETVALSFIDSRAILTLRDLSFLLLTMRDDRVPTGAQEFGAPYY